MYTVVWDDVWDDDGAIKEFKSLKKAREFAAQLENGNYGCHILRGRAKDLIVERDDKK